jgi:hypothetical protein
MTDTKFTPGSWHWHEDKWNGSWSGLYSGDTPVLVPQSCNEGNDGAAWFATTDDAGEEGLADADRALIETAPKLYRQLESLLLMVNRHSDFNDDGDGEQIQRCEAALAEARGEK